MAKLILPELSISVKMPFFANEGIRYDLDRSPQNKISKTSADTLLSLKVAEKAQRQLIEQEARDAEEQLKKKNS